VWGQAESDCPPADVSRKDHRPAGAVYLGLQLDHCRSETWRITKDSLDSSGPQGSAHRTSPETAGETRPARPRQCRVILRERPSAALFLMPRRLSAHLLLQLAESNSMMGTISAVGLVQNILPRKPSRTSLGNRPLWVKMCVSQKDRLQAPGWNRESTPVSLRRSRS